MNSEINPETNEKTTEKATTQPKNTRPRPKSKSSKNKNRKKKKNNSSLIQMGLGIAIVVIILVTTFLLVRWTTTSNELAGVDTDENFNTEAEDYITYLDRESLENFTDDGITTIVMLGDDQLTFDSSANSIPSLLEQQLTGDTKLYNLGFPNTTISCKNETYGHNAPSDAFSLYWLSACIGIGNYNFQKDALPHLGTADDGSFEEKIKLLESIDFNEVDIITMLYGPHDYLNGNLITDVANPDALIAYTGAMNAAVKTIKQTYPHIRMIAISPSYCLVEQADGTKASCDITDTGYGMLADYMVGAKNIAVMNNVTFLDNYFGLEIGNQNYKDYLVDDIHLNAAGNKMVVDRLAKVINAQIPATN